MRNYKNIDLYLNKLSSEIYMQPEDPGHSDWAEQAIGLLYSFIDCPKSNLSVLDVGCATGFCKKLFKPFTSNWVGSDFFIDGTDFSFLNKYEDNSFDIIFARHVLEHSPMPLLTLMEWARISTRYAMIILPAPEYWQVYGRNHYYVLPKENWWNLFNIAGWKIVKELDFTTSNPLFMQHYMVENAPHERVWHGPPKVVEFRYLLEKKDRPQ